MIVPEVGGYGAPRRRCGFAEARAARPVPVIGCVGRQTHLGDDAVSPRVGIPKLARVTASCYGSPRWPVSTRSRVAMSASKGLHERPMRDEFIEVRLVFLERGARPFLISTEETSLQRTPLRA